VTHVTLDPAAGATHFDKFGEDRLVDRGYEGDSSYLAHLGPAAGTDRWDTGRREPGYWDPPTPPSGLDLGTARPTEDAAAGVARRLQVRLDRQLRLLERLQANQLHSDLPELQEIARKMRRDTESLLLLGGHEPGARAGGPRELADLVADAAAVAEESRRVDVRTAPTAHIAPAAAVEFVHVLAELVDHVTAVYPGARVELVSRLEPPLDALATGKGATVDAFVDGTARHDPDGLGGRRAAAAAEQLARCSRHGITLRRPLGGPPSVGSGLVASVHCPPAAVTVPEPPPAPPQPRVNGSSLGSYDFDIGSLGRAASGSNGSGSNGLGSNGSGSNGLGSHGAGSNGLGSNGSSLENGNGAVRPSLSFDEAPAYSPSPSSQVDELFGPLLDLPLEPIDDRYATPIFEAIASAWFREGEQGGGSGRSDPLDWQTPQDDEWRAAAARAARSDPPPTTTSTGLPRRNPGDQLVPPPRRAAKNGQHSDQNSGTSAERVPDRVRDRLSTYQRGLREGRHRAVGSDGDDDW
jgi:hypothetical protein